jgi:hypothetical protein
MIYTFERKRINSKSIYGVIVAESSSLILIHYEDDFQFDGYMVMRRRDVSKWYTSETNAYCEKLMRKEGSWKNPPKAIRSLPLDDWRTLLTALIGKFVIIENERTEDYYIGPVVACEKSFAKIHFFNSCGEWWDLERVPYRGITSMYFGDRYSIIHSRHLPPRPAS